MKPETLTALLAHIMAECSAIDCEARFDAMLDECYSFESIGGPFAYMSPSCVLKECDPVAYRCGVNDYMDGESFFEIEGEYYDQGDVEKARDAFVEEMESNASDLETEIEEIESDDEADPAPIMALNIRLENLRAEISAVESYTF